MKKQYKTYLIIAAFALVFLVGFGFYYYRKGKKQAPAEVILPNDTQGTSVPTNWNPAGYTDAIREDVYEVVGVHEEAPYENALKLSNSQLVAIYNDWNKRYFSENTETIVQAIEKDFTVWNKTWANTAGLFTERLKTLNLY